MNIDTPENWKITTEERTKHNATFMQLGPLNGHLTGKSVNPFLSDFLDQFFNKLFLLQKGEQAKTFFLKSNLSTNVLGMIWNLADINKDGKLDAKEFSIACHLIKKCLTSPQGVAVLPATLPSSLLIDPIVSTLASSTIQPILNPISPVSATSATATLFPASFPSSTTSAVPSSQSSLYSTTIGVMPVQPVPALSNLSGIPPLSSLSNSTALPGQLPPVGGVFTPLASLNTG
jgi:hypothetical protein